MWEIYPKRWNLYLITLPESSCSDSLSQMCDSVEGVKDSTALDYELLDRIVINHFLRSGRFDIAQSLISETQMNFSFDNRFAELDVLRRAWRRLTSTERKLLTLRVLRDLSHREVARELGDIPEKHVRVYVARALARLRSYVDEETNQ